MRKKPKLKPLILIDKDVCPCNPATLESLGHGENPEGEIYFCHKCGIIDKMQYHEIVSLNPLTFTRPMRRRQ